MTPSRLALARRLRGLSQSALAREVDVSPAAIHQFEVGSARPAPETLERLAVTLKVAPAFFARPDVPVGPRPFFRSISRVPAGERERAHAYALAMADVVSEFERHLELPALTITRLFDADPGTSDDDVEECALRARAAWNVPPGPVADAVALAEARGVVVAAVGNFDSGIDAFSVPTPSRPIVVLCSAKGVATRRRFDMLHELAHLSLHRERATENRWQERQAHRFASAVLMPAEEIAGYLPQRGDDLRRLERVAHEWGVSMQAAMLRARDLGLLDAEEYKRGMRRLSSTGWRTKEPVDVGPPERPRLLLAALAALSGAGSSIASIAETLGLPVGRLRRMLSLPETHDDARLGELVPLRG
jgi:Zn-dependent peptidase ImmA (M78 family)/transcriptional regulator with XRE-family HTH domain